MKKYKNYTIENMYIDFSPELLAEGAEWYLSESPVIEVSSGNDDPASFWIRPDIMKWDIAEEKNEQRDELCYYRSPLTEGRLFSNRSTVELCLNKTRGEFVRAWCPCQTFQKEYCSCKHIAGLAFHFLSEQKEEIRGTLIEENLKKLTGLEDPLIPGSLKKTSKDLAHLLVSQTVRYVQNEKPAWQTGEKRSTEVKLNLDIYASAINDALAIELRAGTNRTYQIKNLTVFLDACQDNSIYSFSNKTHQAAGVHHFEPHIQRILEYLIRLKNTRLRKANGNTCGYYYDYYSSYHTGYVSLNASQKDRLMLLTDHDLDEFMELMDGHQIYYSHHRSKHSLCQVNLQKEPSPILMNKTTFGANIMMDDEQEIACGFNRMYLKQKDEILSLPADKWESRKELSTALAGKQQLYVANKDLPTLVSSIYELAGEKQKNALIDFQSYLVHKEKPQIQIYLDYPQDNMITCQIKAYYPSNRKTYDLFLQTQGKKIRDFQVEQAIGEAVWSYFDAWDKENGELVADCGDDRLFLFLTETIPSLSQYGEVLISDRLKRLKVTNNFSINVGVQVDAGSLVMSLHSNEISKEEIIDVLSNYNRRKKYTRLKNGNFITTDETNAAVIEALAETFRTYGKKNPEAMKIPLFRALYIEEMFADRENVQVDAGEDYLKLINRMKDVESRDYPIPEELSGILRNYQKDGYRWICMLKENGFGGILADDMGLGKTIQVLSYLLYDKYHTSGEKLPTLIIVPASLVYNWQKEIQTFTPQLSCSVLAGPLKERKKIFAQLRTATNENTKKEKQAGEEVSDIYITSYDLLKRDIKEYEGIPFGNQIIDEAQYIKNQGTQVAKAVRVIDSSFRMALTGTPIENRLSELWSIFDYIMPGFLYNYTHFREKYESPVVTNHDEEVMERLRSMVHPFILRRLKKDVLKDLPDKIEENISIHLEGEQRKVYDAYAERLRLYLDKQSDEEYHQRKLEILAELTKLRQICCGPELFLENYKGHNAKMQACMELIRQAIDGGHKVLFFSQFTRVLDEMDKYLKKEKIANYRIDGSTSKKERMRLVDAFQDEADHTFVFCISLKAGGTGLNLTAADIVIHYDPWWNLAAQNQATDRTHRIGQTNMVTVYNLIAKDTIEEQITLLQKMKAQLAEDVLSGEGIGSIMIHKEDLLALL